MGKLGLRRSPDATVLPFLTHQVIEYIGGIYLLQVGAKAGGGTAAAVCYVLGGLIVIAAAFSGKPLGGGRLISRPMHRFVDAVLIIAVAAAPFVFGFADQKSTMIRIEILALALVAMGRDIARGLRAQASRKAGAYVGRRMARRRPPSR